MHGVIHVHQGFCDRYFTLTARFRLPSSIGSSLDSQSKSWVQSWVQLEGLFQPKMARKLRQINESLIGYEPEGREFESLRAHHSCPFQATVPNPGV